MKKYFWQILGFSFLFIFILFFFKINKRDSTKIFIKNNKELFNLIENYSSQTPIPYILGKNYPSYHVFFYPYKNDTIMTIFGFPTLVEYDTWFIGKLSKDKWWLNYMKNKKNVNYYASNPEGVYWFKHKTPVIFINCDLYKPEFKSYLKTIPDSLKANPYFGSYHGFKKWYYLYKNGKFIKIELKKDSVWKDKPYYIVK